MDHQILRSAILIVIVIVIINFVIVIVYINLTVHSTIKTFIAWGEVEFNRCCNHNMYTLAARLVTQII